MLLFSFCNKSREYFLFFLKPRGMRKVPERNLYCLHEIRVLKNLFPSCRSVILKWARYCQQHRESVNMKTFHQSEHDTRIWYHGTVASKACLQALPLSPLPRLRWAIWPRFLRSPPPPTHAEPGSRPRKYPMSCCWLSKDRRNYLLYNHQWTTRWAFERTHDIFTRENNMTCYMKRSPLR